tara:strand:- start:300 stop:1259 length:960 start_codon:yes stop_codon:yes gene_type:complete
MADFREFYVQPGAGSNFLAGKCLWKDSNPLNENVSTNEFFSEREKINNTTIRFLYNNTNPSLFNPYDMKDEDFISETKKMKSILLELEDNIQVTPEDAVLKTFRLWILENFEDLWFKDFTLSSVAYSNGPGFIGKDGEMNLRNLLQTQRLSEEKTIELGIQIENYFIRCREYYYKVCEKMDWSSFIITHINPYDAISSRLKLPENFKSLAMELDEEMVMLTGLFSNLKKNGWLSNEMIRTMDNIPPIREKWINNGVKFADDSVSYRKIFIENNGDEIRKMYDFFDNEDYFDENRTNIIKEFKKYHDNNMTSLQNWIKTR